MSPKGLIGFFRKIAETEYKTDAGKVNGLFLLLLIIMTLLIYVPDALQTIVNFILILLIDKQIPQIPPTAQVILLILTILFGAWCVWYVGSIETKRKSR